MYTLTVSTQTMSTLSKRTISILVAGSAMISSFALAGTALAAGPRGLDHSMRPAIVGTVASVSGTTLMVTAKNWQRGTATTTSTTYTVNAANASVTKGSASSTVAAIAVGDSVVVRGTVSGTNITATTILDSMMRVRSGAMPGRKLGMGFASSTITGNGQPVIGGTVTAVSGTTLTITNKSNVIYTVDATSATVSKRGVTSATVTNITIGDNVVIQGTVNSTAVIASSVVDQGTTPAMSTTTTDTNPKPHIGFMGAIGGFFSHLFGFF